MSLTPEEMREELIKKYPGKDIFYRNFGSRRGEELQILPAGGLKRRNEWIDREVARIKAEFAAKGTNLDTFMQNARKAWCDPDWVEPDSYSIVIEAETS